MTLRITQDNTVFGESNRPTDGRPRRYGVASIASLPSRPDCVIRRRKDTVRRYYSSVRRQSGMERSKITLRLRFALDSSLLKILLIKQCHFIPRKWSLGTTFLAAHEYVQSVRRPIAVERCGGVSWVCHLC